MSSPGVGLSTEGPSAGGGAFEHELREEDDPFSEHYVPKRLQGAFPADTNTKSKALAAGLGIDEEVEVTRKPRAPRVKLDEHRLLSAAGIPKLRKRAKDHLKFKGKGHEFSDATRLLQFYQLWLDDLFPKARFLDALAMVEKMGHKKMMQSARVEWINEGKPRSSVHEDSLFDEPVLPRQDDDGREKTAPRIAPIFEKATTDRLKTPVADDFDALFGDDDDIYDATPKAAPAKNVGEPVSQTDSLFGGGAASIFGPRKEISAQEEFPEDDLDALLAEEDMFRNSSKPTPTSKPTAPSDDFDDEMEAMQGMDW
ncbi:hypothetical protein GLAREA_11087 [Glarea lozoyensis ATCC 20868]|uniref:Chromosome segregation in meiosis protein n=1 Tax=Glarea lozoyensis (strain ATCC 20868 / MF5171) TaxID=1116229 RepID=S3EAP6_GLAL2|nr:uncharacterized protein GLAREA_11087 [Glarea lozoyensis ATCC 20868]EPE35388.1 hypothetical protein GLAREA_11087 [Glarea lozoyensis ATCC 20868]